MRTMAPSAASLLVPIVYCSLLRSQPSLASLNAFHVSVNRALSHQMIFFIFLLPAASFMRSAVCRISSGTYSVPTKRITTRAPTFFSGCNLDA